MTKIALLSDIHFGKFSRSTDFCVPGIPIQDENTKGVPFKRSLIELLQKQEIEYIFVAGDLTSEGVPHEFYLCEQSILEIATEVGVPAKNIVLSLGNHDIDWNITKLYDTYAKDCEKDFPIDIVKKLYKNIAANVSSQSISQISPPIDQGPAPFSGIIDYQEIVVFILNSGWCCTHDQELKHGKLDQTQLKWIGEEAAKYKERNCWKIVLIHHHPTNYTYPVPGNDPSMLEEGSELMDIVGQNGIHLVLHGHRHHPRAETVQKNFWENPVTFICAGSLAVNASHRNNGEIPNTLHILELTESLGVLKLYNFKYTSADGWLPLAKSCSEAPLDKVMHLGRIPAKEDIVNAISKYKQLDQATITYDNLDDCLHFLSFDELQRKMTTIMGDTHNVYGEIPENIFFIKK